MKKYIVLMICISKIGAMNNKIELLWQKTIPYFFQADCNDQMAAIITYDNFVLYDKITGAEKSCINFAPDHCMAWSISHVEDNKYMTAINIFDKSGHGISRYIGIYDVEQKQLQSTLPLSDCVRAAQLDQKREYFYCGGEVDTDIHNINKGYLRLYDMKKKILKTSFYLYNSSLTALALDAHNAFCGGLEQQKVDSNCMIRTVDLITGQLRNIGIDRIGWIGNILLDNNHLFTSGGFSETGPINVWDTRSDKCVHQIGVNINNISWLQNNLIASGCADDTIKIWDIRMLKYIKEQDINSEFITSNNDYLISVKRVKDSDPIQDTVYCWQYKN